MAILRLNGNASAFATWSASGRFAQLEVVEVHPRLRKSGHGKVLVQGVLNLLASRGVWAVELECAPAESESFWRSQGFGTFPAEHRNADPHSNTKLWRSILSPGSGGCFGTIQIWHAPWYESKDLLVPTVECPLTSQVVLPYSTDWRVQVRTNEGTLRCNDRVKNALEDIARNGQSLLAAALGDWRETFYGAQARPVITRWFR